MKIAFIVGEFPVVSETFIINQVADLIDRGLEIEIFSFREGGDTYTSERFKKYGLEKRVHYLTPPKNKLVRLFKALYCAGVLIVRNPNAFFHALDSKKYGTQARSLSTLFWITPFLGRDFDLVHCHFGTIANKYLTIRSILGHTQKFITTLYGYDVSHIPKQKGMDYYKKLAKECSLFLVMSNNMKERVLPLGIPEEKIKVHPISIDVESHPFKAREHVEGEKINLISVRRFVEKKGFDDLLRAISIVREKTKRRFTCSIVGDGVLRDDLHNLAKKLKIEDVIDFKGYMKVEDIITLYQQSHIYLQASKTASDGDME